jgi:hypothetical protein
MNGEAAPKAKAYADFEIWIGPPAALDGIVGPSIYPTIVTDSPAGPAFGTLKLDVRNKEFRDRLGSARSDKVDKQARMDLGKELFRALFADDVRGRWNESKQRISPDTGLRLRLWLNVAELADLPWELLCEEKTGSFLAKAGGQSVSRYLPVSEPVYRRIEGKLRVLLVVQNPPWDNKRIEPGAVNLIAGQIRKLEDEVHLEILENKSLNQIQDELLNDYHILHFLGHGMPSELLFVEEGGTTKTVGAETFATFLEKRGLSLVVLNACASSQEEGGDLFSGVGPTLVQRGMPAVVAMQYPSVYVDTAGIFSWRFYRALAKGIPVDVAVNEGRQSISAEYPDERDWSTPVLYMGTRTGRVLYRHPSDVVQEVAGESRLAAAAMMAIREQAEEIARRSGRLRDWLRFDLEIQELRRSIGEIHDLIMEITNAAREGPGQLWLKFSDLDGAWELKQGEIDSFLGLKVELSHILQCLSCADPKVAEWFADLELSRDHLHGLFDKLSGDLAMGKDKECRPVVGQLVQDYRNLRELLRKMSTDGRTAFRGEAKELKERTNSFHSDLEV